MSDDFLDVVVLASPTLDSVDLDAEIEQILREVAPHEAGDAGDQHSHDRSPYGLRKFVTWQKGPTSERFARRAERPEPLFVAERAQS